MIVERLVASKAHPAPAPASIHPAAQPPGVAEAPRPASPAGQSLARLRAETERAKVLVEFLGRPICAHGGTEPDPDIVTAYNLAVEAALHGIRRAAQAIPG